MPEKSEPKPEPKPAKEPPSKTPERKEYADKQRKKIEPSKPWPRK